MIPLKGSKSHRDILLRKKNPNQDTKAGINFDQKMRNIIVSEKLQQ